MPCPDPGRTTGAAASKPRACDPPWLQPGASGSRSTRHEPLALVEHYTWQRVEHHIREEGTLASWSGAKGRPVPPEGSSVLDCDAQGMVCVSPSARNAGRGFGSGRVDPWLWVNGQFRLDCPRVRTCGGVLCRGSSASGGIFSSRLALIGFAWGLRTLRGIRTGGPGGVDMWVSQLPFCK